VKRPKLTGGARDSYKSLVDVPGRPFGLDLSAQPALHVRSIGLLQRQTVVWSTDNPRSAISSSTSRRLSEKRRYHRTQVTIARQRTGACGTEVLGKSPSAHPARCLALKLQHFHFPQVLDYFADIIAPIAGGFLECWLRGKKCNLGSRKPIPQPTPAIQASMSTFAGTYIWNSKTL